MKMLTKKNFYRNLLDLIRTKKFDKAKAEKLVQQWNTNKRFLMLKTLTVSKLRKCHLEIITHDTLKEEVILLARAAFEDLSRGLWNPTDPGCVVIVKEWLEKADMLNRNLSLHILHVQPLLPTRTGEGPAVVVMTVNDYSSLIWDHRLDRNHLTVDPRCMIPAAF